MRLGVYNQGATAVIIDGVTAVDLGSEFAYQIIMPEVGSKTLGTERAVNNMTTNKTCDLNISLLPSSSTNDQLLQLYYNQVRGQGKEFSITIFSTEGEKWGFDRCIIKKPGDAQGGGTEQQPRIWEISVCEVVPDASLYS